MSTKLRLHGRDHCALRRRVATVCLGGVLAGTLLACSGESDHGGSSAPGLLEPQSESLDERVPAKGDDLEAHEARDGAMKGRGRLVLTTTDAWDYYVHAHPDPWFMQSTVTEANVFQVQVTNDARRPAHDLELFVAVPRDIVEGGWSVTVGSPGTVFSRPEDFPETHLTGTGLKPHRVYGKHGNARFVRIEGPPVLGPGETWTVPLQVFRGDLEDFEVHFDASSREFWNTPMHDVTSQPPMGGSEERVLHPAH